MSSYEAPLDESTHCTVCFSGRSGDGVHRGICRLPVASARGSIRVASAAGVDAARRDLAGSSDWTAFGYTGWGSLRGLPRPQALRRALLRRAARLFLSWAPIAPSSLPPWNSPTASPQPTAVEALLPYELSRPVDHSTGDCPGVYILGRITDRQGNVSPDVTLRLTDEYGNQQTQNSKTVASEVVVSHSLCLAPPGGSTWVWLMLRGARSARWSRSPTASLGLPRHPAIGPIGGSADMATTDLPRRPAPSPWLRGVLLFILCYAAAVRWLEPALVEFKYDEAHIAGQALDLARGALPLLSGGTTLGIQRGAAGCVSAGACR